MIKLTVRYKDEKEFRRFQKMMREYITVIHPNPQKPAKYQPGNGLYRRYVNLKDI